MYVCTVYVGIMVTTAPAPESPKWTPLSPPRDLHTESTHTYRVSNIRTHTFTHIHTYIRIFLIKKYPRTDILYIHLYIPVRHLQHSKILYIVSIHTVHVQTILVTHTYIQPLTYIQPEQESYTYSTYIHMHVYVLKKRSGYQRWRSRRCRLGRSERFRRRSPQPTNSCRRGCVCMYVCMYRCWIHSSLYHVHTYILTTWGRTLRKDPWKILEAWIPA